MNVELLERAADDLESIYTWIANDSEVSARNVDRRIRERIRQLKNFPLIGRVGAVGGTYELIVPGLPYIIVYRVNVLRDIVTVLQVVHGARDRTQL